MARMVHKQEFAVIGLGRFGTAVSRTLLERGYTVLGLDRSREAVQPLSDELTEALILDATDEDALRSIDIALYNAVVVTINDDFEDELLTTVTLKNLGVPRIVAVASDERQRTILLKVGADEVVMPEFESGQRLGLMLALPNLVERLDHTVIGSAAAHLAWGQGPVVFRFEFLEGHRGGDTQHVPIGLRDGPSRKSNNPIPS